MTPRSGSPGSRAGRSSTCPPNEPSTYLRVMGERASRDARQNRWLRSLLVTIAVLLIGSAIGGSWPSTAGRRRASSVMPRPRLVAERQRRRLTARGRPNEQHRGGHAREPWPSRNVDVAVAREVAAAATADLPVDAERSVLLALAAVEPPRDGIGSSGGQEALHRALTRTGSTWPRHRSGGAVVEPRQHHVRHEGADGFGVVDIRDAPPARRCVHSADRRRHHRRRLQRRRHDARNDGRRRHRPGLGPAHRPANCTSSRAAVSPHWGRRSLPTVASSPPPGQRTVLGSCASPISAPASLSMR